MAHLLAEAEFWVAVAFVILVVAVARKIWGGATTALDNRAGQIKDELDEAKRLREEAQHALAEYKRLQRDAAQEAEEILRLASNEADIMRERARDDLTQAVQRREEQAVARIAQAESEATQQVRDLAVDIAVAATGKVLQDNLQGDAGNQVIDKAIKDLPSRLN